MILVLNLLIKFSSVRKKSKVFTKGRKEKTMSLRKNSLRWAGLLSGLIFTIFFVNQHVAQASYYEISGSGTWTTFSSSSYSGFDNSGNWQFSFDLPSSLTLTSGTNSLVTSSGTLLSYPGLTTYQAQLFNFNNLTSSQDEFVNQSGSHSGSFGSIGTGTFTYTGGITFGTGGNTFGTISLPANGFLVETCLSGCQTDPSEYGADGFFVSLASNTPSNGILLSSSTETTGNSLNLFSGNIDLNLDGGAGIGTGMMDISLISGSLPGTGTLSATPEPSSWFLMGTGLLFMGGLALRKTNFRCLG